MESLIIIPTYNERENIDALLEKVFGLGLDVGVLIVDDNSPDGTGEHVASLKRENDRLHLLQRPGKMGLGSAYIAGFKWALANTDAEYVFEMDADFSHDPNALPQFLDAVKDVDLVIGSRYLEGITVMNWPLSRLFLSVGANIYTRVITGMPLMVAGVATSSTAIAMVLVPSDISTGIGLPDATYPSKVLFAPSSILVTGT